MKKEFKIRHDGLSQLPMLPLATFLAIGAAMGLEMDWAWGEMLGIGLVVLIAYSFFRKRLHEWAGIRDTVFIVLVCYCAFAGGGFNTAKGRSEFVGPGKKYELTGTVVNVIRRDSSMLNFIIETDSLAFGGNALTPYKTHGHIESGRYNVKSWLPIIKCGERVRLSGTTMEPYQDLFTTFDYKYFLKIQGISFSAHAYNLELLNDEKFSLAAITGGVNEWYVDCLKKMGVTPQNIGFLRALVLADRSQLPFQLKEDFAACGTSHVLAVSGLHVAVLAYVASLIFSSFCGRRTTSVLTTITLWAYATIVGLGPSVVRAATMFTFLQINDWRGRKMPPFHSLTAALTLILVFDPNSVGNIGLWLSFSSVAGLCALSKPADRWISNTIRAQEGAGLLTRIAARLARIVAMSVAVSVIAQVSTIPVILYSFQTFPTYFWLNNLVIIPAIWVTFNAAVFSPLLAVIPTIGGVCGDIINALLSFIANYCHWAAELPNASITTGPKSLLTLTASALFITTLVLYIRHGGIALRRATMATLGCALIAFSIVDAGRKPEVAVISAAGRLNLVVTDGWTAKCLTSDPHHSSSMRAVKSWANNKGLTVSELRPMGPVEVAHLGGHSLGILNDPETAAPDCDICVVNCNAVEKAPLNDSTRFYVASLVFDCPQWKHRTFTPLKNNDILLLSDF